MLAHRPKYHCFQLDIASMRGYRNAINADKRGYRNVFDAKK